MRKNEIMMLKEKKNCFILYSLPLGKKTESPQRSPAPSPWGTHRYTQVQQRTASASQRISQGNAAITSNGIRQRQQRRRNNENINKISTQASAASQAASSINSNKQTKKIATCCADVLWSDTLICLAPLCLVPLRSLPLSWEAGMDGKWCKKASPMRQQTKRSCCSFSSSHRHLPIVFLCRELSFILNGIFLLLSHLMLHLGLGPGEVMVT